MSSGFRLIANDCILINWNTKTQSGKWRAQRPPLHSRMIASFTAKLALWAYPLGEALHLNSLRSKDLTSIWAPIARGSGS
jgi:hypothetical protein